MTLLTYSLQGAEVLGKLFGLAVFLYVFGGFLVVPPSVLLGGM